MPRKYTHRRYKNKRNNQQQNKLDAALVRKEQTADDIEGEDDGEQQQQEQQSQVQQQQKPLNEDDTTHTPVRESTVEYVDRRLGEDFIEIEKEKLRCDNEVDKINNKNLIEINEGVPSVVNSEIKIVAGQKDICVGGDSTLHELSENKTFERNSGDLTDCKTSKNIIKIVSVSTFGFDYEVQTDSVLSQPASATTESAAMGEGNGLVQEIKTFKTSNAMKDLEEHSMYYRVDSPKEVTVKLKKNMQKSKSLDDNTVLIQEASDNNSSSIDDLTETNGIVTEVETDGGEMSDKENESNQFEVAEIKVSAAISPQSSSSALTSSSSPARGNKPIRTNDSYHNFNDPYASASTSIAGNYQNTRYLHIIKEESDTSDVERKFDDIVKGEDIDLDDDVFIDNVAISRKANTIFPKSKLDFTKRRKRDNIRNHQSNPIQEETVCVLLDTKLINQNNESIETCSTCTTELIEQEGAEMVYLASSSSSTSDALESDDADEADTEDYIEDPDVRITTPVIDEAYRYNYPFVSLAGLRDAKTPTDSASERSTPHADVAENQTEYSAMDKLAISIEVHENSDKNRTDKISDDNNNNYSDKNLDDNKNNTNSNTEIKDKEIDIVKSEFKRQNSDTSTTSSSTRSQVTARYISLDRNYETCESSASVSSSPIANYPSGGGNEPQPLRNICIQYLKRIPYGCIILDEIAKISKSVNLLLRQDSGLSSNSPPFLDHRTFEDIKLYSTINTRAPAPPPTPPPINQSMKTTLNLSSVNRNSRNDYSNDDGFAAVEKSHRRFENAKADCSTTLSADDTTGIMSTASVVAVNSSEKPEKKQIVCAKNENENDYMNSSENRLLAIIRNSKETSVSSSLSSLSPNENSAKKNLGETQESDCDNGEIVSASLTSSSTSQQMKSNANRKQQYHENVIAIANALSDVDSATRRVKSSIINSQCVGDDGDQPGDKPNPFKHYSTGDLDLHADLDFDFDAFLQDRNQAHFNNYNLTNSRLTVHAGRLNTPTQRSAANDNKLENQKYRNNNSCEIIHDQIKNNLKNISDEASANYEFKNNTANEQRHQQQQQQQIERTTILNTTEKITKMTSTTSTSFSKNYEFLNDPFGRLPTDTSITNSNNCTPKNNVNEFDLTKFNQKNFDKLYKSRNFINNNTADGSTSTTIKRHNSLPKEINLQQLEYIKKKEQELNDEYVKLEEERQRLEEEMQSINQFIQKTKSIVGDDYKISKKHDFAIHQNDILDESSKKNLKMKNLNSLNESEQFRRQMHNEWVTEVAEREKRKSNKIIKITKADGSPLPTTVTASILEQQSPSQQFLNKVMERRSKIGLPADSDWDSGSESQPIITKTISEETFEDVKIYEGDSVTDLAKLPQHFKEFVEYTTNAKTTTTDTETETTETSMTKTNGESSTNKQKPPKNKLIGIGLIIAVVVISWTLCRATNR